MTMSAPHCTCEDSIFPSFGRPCPIHGSKWNRMEADACREAAIRLKAENDRLRELYANVVQNQQRFGWTINHLLECEEALRYVEEDNARLRAENKALRAGEQTTTTCRAPHCWSEYGTPCGTCPVPSSPTSEASDGNP